MISKSCLNEKDIKGLKKLKELGYTHIYKDQYYGLMVKPKQRGLLLVDYPLSLKRLLEVGEEYSIEELLR